MRSEKDAASRACSFCSKNAVGELTGRCLVCGHSQDASRSRWLRDRAIANTFQGRPVLTPRQDMPGPASDRADWPVHQPRAWDAPIPGRHWYAGCEPGGENWDSELGRYTGQGPRVNPATGLCEGCGEPACRECGREGCAA